MTRASLYIASIAGLAMALALPAAAASPTCTGTSEHLMSWPDDDPVWEFCWLRPEDSSANSGSGLEIRDVHYRGTLVLKRGHVPILNVDYDPGGCGCFRDWLDSEHDYRTGNPVNPDFFEPPFPAETVCDHATEPLTPPGDCPWGGNPAECLEGVSAEYFADHVMLSTQAQAGWYRYDMRWTFWLDGTIEPTFGFGTYSDACGNASHRHHAYWRLDFDIDDADGDTVTQVGGSLPGLVAQEDDRTWEDGSVVWEVHDGTTGRGYRVTPGAQDILLPVDTFSQIDLMISRYHSDELNDSGGGCEVNVNTIIDGEQVENTDVVLWYRGGVHDQVGVNIYECKRAGPTLTPLGDWGAEFTGYADGFESGDTTAWSTTVP